MGATGRGKQREVLKPSETRWDQEVFLALAGDAQLGQPAQPGTQPAAQTRGFPAQGQPPSAAGQPHMGKDITVSVAAMITDMGAM